MSDFRIRGLVREAQKAQRTLRAGVPPDERDAFLASVRRVVARGESLLAEAGAREADLPRPSRAALRELRSIAKLPPSALVAPDPDHPVRRRVRVRNVVGTLDRCLDALDDGTAEADAIASVRALARECADRIEQLCVEQDGHTAGLPDPSRRAYAMLRWLGSGENLDRYAAQVRLFVEALPRIWKSIDGRPRMRGPARLRFEPMRALLRQSPPRGSNRWRLDVGMLAADEADLRAVLESMSNNPAMAVAARERRILFLDSEAFGAVQLELRRLADPVPFRPRGRVYDLDALFVRLDREYFRGTLEKPHLDWLSTSSRRTFGLFVPSLDLACVNPILDDADVPAFVAETVLYHELLHKKHGTSLRSGRAHVHTPAFRTEERLHPDLREADRWISALAAGHPRPAAPGSQAR